MEARTTSLKPDGTWYVACAVLVCLFVVHTVATYYVSDDAFISFRYVKNFLEGHGLVFNPGERVEGYTDFLWVMLLAGIQFMLPQIRLLLISQALGVLLGALTIVLVLRFSWKFRMAFWPFGVLGGLFLAAHSGFNAWAMGGLETQLFAFLVFAAAFAYVDYLETGKRWWLAPLLFALATMTRPDGLLLFGLTGIHAFFRERRRSGQWLNRRIVLWALVFVAVYLPYFLWRFNYYGYLFPNTFYAKTASGTSWFMYNRGLRYLRGYFVNYGFFVPLLPLTLLLRRHRESWIGYFVLLVLGYLSYIVYVGGDGLAFFRFVTYIAPLFYLLVQEGIAELHDSAARLLSFLKGPVLAAGTVVLVLGSLAFTMRQSVRPILFPERSRWLEPQCELRFPGIGADHNYRWFDNYFVDRLATAARWLQENAPPGSLVASTPAGSIAYHMDLPVIDMLGLNDEHIARSPGTYLGGAGKGRAGHEKGDGKYVLSRSPDYILMGNVAVLPFPLDETTMSKKLVLKSEHDLWGLSEFHEKYELVSVRLADQGVFQYFTFYRKRQPALPSMPKLRGNPAAGMADAKEGPKAQAKGSAN